MSDNLTSLSQFVTADGETFNVGDRVTGIRAKFVGHGQTQFVGTIADIMHATGNGYTLTTFEIRDDKGRQFLVRSNAAKRIQ